MSFSLFYVGPTITGAGTRNTIYDGTPETLETAIRAAGFLAGLCVPPSGMADALSQIERKRGGFYQLYEKAVRESESIRAAIQERSEQSNGSL